MNIGELQRKLSIWAGQRLAESEPSLFATRKDLRLHDLYHLLYDKDWLRLAYEHVSQNAGSKTAGCDGVSMMHFKRDLEVNLQKLAEDLKTQIFRPNPVRRVYIPKKNGKMRPLGIPSIRDRIVQEALRMVLEPIFEAEFYRNSYGFRPNRSTLDALAMVSASCTPQKKCYWVIEGDIKSYFDTINHDILMKLLRRRIRDKKLLRLVWRFLRAGVMEGKLFTPTDEGTPQGGIISPLLANVYLHELDMYLARHADLAANIKRQRRRAGKANFVHIRYADDFVVLCNGSKADAEVMRERIREFLTVELKLTLSMEKTKITHVDDGFKFLGYNVKRGVVGTGQKLLKFLIPREAQQKLREVVFRTMAPSSASFSINAKITALNSHLRGWGNYFRYAHNVGKVFSMLDDFVFWQTAHWLGRKFRCSMPTVLKRHYRRVDGVQTIATDETAVVRLSRIGAQLLRLRTFTNPYTTATGLIVREDQDGRTQTWYGSERRPGMADLRPLILKLDQWSCQNCGQPVTEATAHVDHVRAVRRFKRPVDANTVENLHTLCIDCHKVKTKSERQMESRMQ
jgi:RNA-directed DNA polymerase